MSQANKGPDSKKPKLDTDSDDGKVLDAVSRDPSPAKKKVPKPAAEGEKPAKKEFPVFTTPKSKDSAASAKSTASSSSSSTSLIEELKTRRAQQYESVLAFPFNKKRCRVLSTCKDIPDDAEGILYWMSRDQRVHDNWALLYAQKIALKQEVPLYVCFCLQTSHLGAPLRHFHFMLEGLKEVERDLRELKIPFHILFGPPAEQIPLFIKNNKIGGLICEFSPLRISLKWLDDLKKVLPADLPVVQIDAHNVVPCWHASDKLEYAARTIRNKINSKLDDFLTEFPPVIPHTYHKSVKHWPEPIDWDACYASLKCDLTVKKVDWAVPGYTGGMNQLESFIKNRLKAYDEDRNEPNRNALSNLSPWTHYGQISAQRCSFEVKKYASKYSKSVQGFMEEAIVRRELAENFCYYQPNYDNLDGAYDWARKTLSDHAKDKRQYLYTLDDLDNFRTHDKLWNAAQIQMRVEGKMHGFLRMYWAKKILEWTASPQQALEFSIYLNDRYQLDGRDAAGYVGCMWSIAGIHDQGWAERAIYGKIRCMTYDGCKRKFDVDSFAAKYLSKKHLV